MKLLFSISLVLFFLTIFLLGHNLNKPFWGEHDWNGARYGNIARNYLKYGLFQLNFGQIENSGFSSKEDFEYFTHYPPLLPILIFLSYISLGISEFSTRLIPVLATAGSITLIFLISHKIWDLKTGFLAAAFALSTPLVNYFGKTPVHEPLVVFFSLLAFYGYLSYKKSNNLFNKSIFSIGLILAHLTTWAGFFLLPAITLIELVKHDFKQAKRILPFYLIPIILILFHLLHTFYLTGSFWGGDLKETFLLRSAISSPGQLEGLNLLGYINRLRLWISTLYTLTLTFLVLFYLLSRKIPSLKEEDWILLALGLFGVFYHIIFPNASFIHNYLTFYLLPFFSIAGARGLIDLLKFVNLSKLVLILGVLISIFISLERRDFVDALNKSDADKFAVEIGKEIKKNTISDDVVLIYPATFSYTSDKFLRFYSDRNLIYSDNFKIPHNIRVLIDQQHKKFEIIQVE